MSPDTQEVTSKLFRSEKTISHKLFFKSLGVSAFRRYFLAGLSILHFYKHKIF